MTKEHIGFTEEQRRASLRASPTLAGFVAPGPSVLGSWLELLCGCGVAAGVVAEECLTVEAPKEARAYVVGVDADPRRKP